MRLLQRTTLISAAVDPNGSHVIIYYFCSSHWWVLAGLHQRYLLSWLIWSSADFLHCAIVFIIFGRRSGWKIVWESAMPVKSPPWSNERWSQWLRNAIGESGCRMRMMSNQMGCVTKSPSKKLCPHTKQSDGIKSNQNGHNGFGRQGNYEEQEKFGIGKLIEDKPHKAKNGATRTECIPGTAGELATMQFKLLFLLPCESRRTHIVEKQHKIDEKLESRPSRMWYKRQESFRVPSIGARRSQMTRERTY